MVVVRGKESHLGQGSFAKGWKYDWPTDTWILEQGPFSVDLVYIKDTDFPYDTWGRYVNSLPFESLCNQKNTAYDLFPALFPKTATVLHAEELKSAVHSLEGDRIVAKPVTGSGGRGVVIGTKEEILKRIESGEIDTDALSKLLENPPTGRHLYCKVSEKGGLSVYGLQRMPVTLYVEQWGRLLEFADTLKQFMKDNDDKLKRKGQ